MTKKELAKQEVLKRKEERLAKKQLKELEQRQKREVLEKSRELKDKTQFRLQLENYKTLIRHIQYLISEKEDNHTIGYSFFNERNAPFELSNTVRYRIDFVKSEGEVREHINGRTNVGIYAIWAILIGNIKTWKDLRKFYLQYCCWIQTSAKFNNAIKKHQNFKDGGAIAASVYIDEYEKEYEFKFTDKQRQDFSSRFLSTNYGKITETMVIERIRQRAFVLLTKEEVEADRSSAYTYLL